MKKVRILFVLTTFVYHKARFKKRKETISLVTRFHVACCNCRYTFLAAFAVRCVTALKGSMCKVAELAVKQGVTKCLRQQPPTSKYAETVGPRVPTECVSMFEDGKWNWSKWSRVF